jgi:protein phosphatase PTC7
MDAMRAVAAPRASAARPARAARDATTRRRVVAGASRYALCAHGENLPHPDKTAKGGEDAWFARVSAANGGGALGVADGVGGFNDQGVDPGLYARVLSYEGLRACDGGDGGFFGSSAKIDPRAIAIEAQAKTTLPGAATMCVVALDGKKLTCANVGDSGFRVVRRGGVTYGSTAGQHYFNCPYQLAYEALAKDCDSARDADVYSFDVEAGDVVVAGSDGLFDNVFDEEIASVVNAAYASAGDAASAAESAAKALVKVARKHAEDKKYDSPYAREMAKSETDKGGAPKAVGLFGGFQQMLGGGNLGGKMDDITVVVATVVDTASSQRELARSEAVCDANTKALTKARGLASIEETKVARTVALRKEMDDAFNEKVAEVNKREKAVANAKSEFTRAQIDSMDAPTVRKLLQERGLPTSGKIDRLRDRLAEVKAL